MNAPEISHHFSVRPFERLLASYAPLTEAQLARVRRQFEGVSSHVPEASPLGIRDEDGRIVLVVSGWAAAICDLEDGRRQIVTLFLPGDLVGPPFSALGGLEAVALTELRTLDATGAVALLSGRGGPVEAPLVEAWKGLRNTAEARLARHIVRLGRMSAYERTADLLLELDERQGRAGLSDGQGSNLPLTQEMMAAHLGLSAVHMNRTLQQLRRDGMIAVHGGRLFIPDPARLAQVTLMPSLGQVRPGWPR